MSEQQTDQQRYSVSVHEAEGTPGAFIFTFMPKGVQQARAVGGQPNRVPRYVVAVRVDGDSVTFDWVATQDAPGVAQQELEQEVRDRLEARKAWVSRVTDLVALIEQWAKDLGWATRRIQKRLDDSYVGRHEVLGLLMQEDTTRVLLEPVGRSAPGVGGVVDLYLMPAYDDIATLYYYDNGWNLHYSFPGTNGAVNTREAPGKPLSKDSLREVLAEMKQHAATA